MNTEIESNKIIIRFVEDKKLKLPPTCIIRNSFDYWNGYKWTNIETHLQMDNIADNAYIYILNFDPTVNYKISIFDEFNNMEIESNNIAATETPEIVLGNPDEIVLVSNRTLKQSNGDDTTVMDEDAKLLKGVKVIAINKDSLEEKETSSDDNGEWKLKLKHGNYVFIFSLDNYNQISIEKEV